MLNLDFYSWMQKAHFLKALNQRGCICVYSKEIKEFEMCFFWGYCKFKFALSKHMSLDWYIDWTHGHIFVYGVVSCLVN